MKLAIIGSRSISDIDMKQYIKTKPTCIISGGAKGIDTIAAKYAIDNGIQLHEIRPNYAQYGRGATFIRNRQIVDSCDVLLAFWDGKSKGTQYTINYARKNNKTINVITI